MFLENLHIIMELAAAFCLFFISFVSFKYRANGVYSTIVGIGTAIAGSMDVVHAVMSAGHYITYWTPFSWALSRATLLIMFLLVAFCHTKYACATWRLVLIMLSPILFMFAQPFLISDLSFVYTPIVISDWLTIYRPLDFMLLVGWIAMAYLLRSKSRVLFPPHTFYLFMAQGIMLHAVMAFLSSASLDPGFMIAHALKITEYYTLILLYIMYKYIGSVKLNSALTSADRDVFRERLVSMKSGNP